jgi:exodeoxyribonuclease V beta subunit
VALTRAKHQAVIWWAPSRDSRSSALARLLFNRDEAGNVSADGSAEPPTDAAATARFRALAAQAPGRITVAHTSVGLPVAWSPPLPPSPELRAASFERQLDLRWRRTSYSDITADAHDPLVASEPERPMLDDEPAGPAPADAPREPAGTGADRPSPMGSLPAGVEFGTFVHGVLEATDFAAVDLDAELSERVAASGSRRGVDIVDRGEAIAGLRAALETPLGGLVDEIRLRDLGRQDRLDELEFELPLAGGDEPMGGLTLRAIADALRSHLPPGDPMAQYAARLTDPALRTSVRGFLTGSIDLVMRLPGPRFAIVDYKTNWLGAADAALTLGSYAPAALAAEMQRAHYGLQALLYTVALHRYLRARMPDYEPGRHLAAVLYLFVRGMAGADTPVIDGERCGVFAWRPPGALVRALSDVLDRGGA